MNQGVSKTVLDKEYRTDDFNYLISKNPDKNFVPIVKDDVLYRIKDEKLHNRKDLTSCFIKPENEWTKEEKFDSLLG